MTEKKSPIISFKNFSFQYRAQKKPTLKEINLDIYPGERVLIAGPSGCGKSTMLKSIAGLLDIEKGRICLDEKEIQNMAPEKRGTVIVFQDLRLFPVRKLVRRF